MNFIIRGLNFIISILALQVCNGQDLTFTNTPLKEYMISEECCSLSNNNFNQSADQNNDGEISIEEAEAIQSILIRDIAMQYQIKTLQEIHFFTNLKVLKVNNSYYLEEITLPPLDSLESFQTSSNQVLKTIDVSRTTYINDLRIEDCIDTLEYLNIQNGTVAENFSLFYCEKIAFACVDEEEYELVAPNVLDFISSENCINQNKNLTIEQSLTLYPNPTSGILFLDSIDDIVEINLMDMSGSSYFNCINHCNKINTSFLLPGVYLIKISTERGSLISKFIKY